MSNVVSPQQYADKVLRLSHHIHQMAIAQNWDMCSQLEEERQRTLEALFDHPQIPAALESISDVLQQVMCVDGESLVICEKHKMQVAAEIKQLHDGQRAVNTYTTYSA